MRTGTDRGIPTATHIHLMATATRKELKVPISLVCYPSVSFVRRPVEGATDRARGHLRCCFNAAQTDRHIHIYTYTIKDRSVSDCQYIIANHIETWRQTDRPTDRQTDRQIHHRHRRHLRAGCAAHRQRTCPQSHALVPTDRQTNTHSLSSD